jgi:hypothetical protein
MNAAAVLRDSERFTASFCEAEPAGMPGTRGTPTDHPAWAAPRWVSLRTALQAQEADNFHKITLC